MESRGDTASITVNGAMLLRNAKVITLESNRVESRIMRLRKKDQYVVKIWPDIFAYVFIFMFRVSEIRCPEPVLAEHGILSVTGNDRMYGRTLIRTGTAENSNTGATSYKIGALAKYRCERGYKVVGEPLSTCEENGKWSGEVPQCVCKYPWIL